MIDDVLAELQAVGQVESEGEFSMDRAKAREKMRRFQLADPRAYVLELVQAASLKGASAIRFQIDSRDMVMEFDGRPFTTADFDDIYGAALTRRLDHDVLARRQLALGINSAMALRPSRIVVESGDGRSGARLRLEPDEEDHYEAIETTRMGTRIHVRERFRLGTFVAFFKDLSGTLAEEQLLRAHCGHASLTIDLEGTYLDHGLRLAEPLLDVITLRTEHTQASCGLHQDGDRPPQARIIKDGVWITDHELPKGSFPLGFMAVVQDHAIRKDVSQGDIVRDPAHAAMIGVLQEGAARAVAALAQRSLDGRAPLWATAELLSQLLRLAELGGPWAVDEPTGRVRVLRRLPLWETVDRRRLCLDEIFAEDEAAGSVAFTTRSRYEGLPLPGHAFVLYLVGIDDDADRRKRILHAIFGDRLRDESNALDLLWRREKARRAWRTRVAQPRLPEGAYLARRTIEAAGVRAEVGITAEVTEHSRVGLVIDGCMIAEELVELPWLGLRVVVEADAFQPTESFSGIMRDAATFRALLPVAEAIPGLYGELSRVPASAWRDTCAMSMLESLLRADSLGIVFATALCEVAPTLAAAEVEAFGAAKLRPALDLLGPAPHPVATMPLFPTLGPRRYSLVQLVERARANERISVVAKVEPRISADILVLDEDDRALLQPLFARPFEDATAEVGRLVREREFLQAPTGGPTLDARAPAVVVPIEGEGITGMLRVDPTAEPQAWSQRIVVLHRQRPIDGLPLLLVGRCEGWVESQAVQPRADYRGVKSGMTLDLVRAAVLRAFAAACVCIARRARVEPAAHDLAFLREVAALVFPSKALRAVYDKLARTKEVSRAKVVEAHGRLYAAMHVQSDAAALEQRLMRMSRSNTAIADALGMESPRQGQRWALAAVDVLFPPTDVTSHDPGARALRPVAALGELPLFRRHDRRALTLTALRGLASNETVLHIDAPADDVDMGTRVVVVADVEELEILRRILGPSRLLRGDGPVERERERQQLQAKPKAEVIALPPGEALVSVRWRETRSRASIEGEVGLALEHPGDPSRAPRLRLRVYRERVEIQVAQVDEQPAELVASANHDRLTLSADFRAVHRNKAFKELVERGQARVPELVAQLVARWPELPPMRRMTAWYHVLDFLRANQPAGLLAEWGHALATQESFRNAAQLPGFTLVSGAPRSAAQLVEAHARNGRLDVLPKMSIQWGDSPLPPERPVVCADAYELAVLRSLLPAVESVEGSWGHWQQRARNRDGAPPASTLASVQPLVSHELRTPGVVGWLAIPPGGRHLGLELCAEGRVVVKHRPKGVLPCVGSVTGPQVVVNEHWTDATLQEQALTTLQLASIELYRALARWFVEHGDHPERLRVGGLLADQVVALAKRGQTPEPRWQTLLGELRPLPVLPLRNGRRISLQTALDEQPDELGHLDLWPSRAHRLQQMYASQAAAAPKPAPAPTFVSAPKPASAAAPKPAPPEPTPEERLVDALRAELGLVRERNRSLLSDLHLDRIRLRPLPWRHRALVARADDDGVTVNRDHPVVTRALAEHTRDPVWLSYVSSAVYTALNVQLEDVTDADERSFLEHMARLVGG